MALTFTSLAKMNLGSVNAVMYNVSSDGTSGAVLTSLGYIFGGTVTPVSQVSASIPQFKVNTTTGSAVCNGAFFISGGSAGDVYTVVVYGKS